MIKSGEIGAHLEGAVGSGQKELSATEASRPQAEPTDGPPAAQADLRQTTSPTVVTLI